MTALSFVENLVIIIFNLLFNVFKVPNTNNVYIGWILISALTMGMTLKTILNIPRSIPKLNFRKEKDNG